MSAKLKYQDKSFEINEIVWDRDSLFIDFVEYWEKLVGYIAQLIAEHTTSEWGNFNLVRTNIIKSFGINPETVEINDTAPIKLLPVSTFSIILANSTKDLIKDKSPEELNTLTSNLINQALDQNIVNIKPALIQKNIDFIFSLKGVKHFLITNDSQKNNDLFLKDSNTETLFAKSSTEQNMNNLNGLFKKTTLLITKNKYLASKYKNDSLVNVLLIEDLEDIKIEIKENNTPIVIYTDGASRGNPGPAGIGVAIYENGDIINELYDYIGEKTNNQAEYQALIKALEFSVEQGYQQVLLKADSELMVKQTKGEYKIKDANIKEFMKTIKSLTSQIGDFKITHVKREENKIADQLANKAIDEYN